MPETPTRLGALAILAVGGFVTESFAVRVGPGNCAEVSAGGIVIILAAVLLGPLAAGVVGFAELLRDARRPPLARWLAHAPLRCPIALAAGAATSRIDTRARTRLFASVAAAWAAMTVVDIAGNSAIAYLRGIDLGRFLRDSLLAGYLPFVFYLPIVWATAVAFRSAGLVALVLVLGPTLLAQYIFHLYQQRGQAYDDLTEASLSFAIGMIPRARRLRLVHGGTLGVGRRLRTRPRARASATRRRPPRSSSSPPSSTMSARSESRATSCASRAS